MNESGLWQYIKQGMMGSGWHPTRIESSAGNGVPDVSYGLPGINGWIELKHIPEWSVRNTTKVKLPLRPEQKHWIKARGELSGNVWVIVRIADMFYLLNHKDALEAYEGWTQAEWKSFATFWWYKRIDFKGLYSHLKGG
jgi:hypothetical protein